MKRYVDYIRDIIIVFSEDEAKEFSAFIQRQRSKKSRMDLSLFQELRKDDNKKPSEICKALYGSDKNMNAYHSVRKRLLKQLMEFVVLKRMDEDTTSASSIMGLLSVSLFLFENNMNGTAWFYLLKCEELALKTEHFDLLDNIYNAQIAHANDSEAPALNNIIANWKTNKTLADEDERANIANMIIKLNLERQIKEGISFKIDKEIDRVLTEYHLNDIVLKRPRLLFNFLSIIRSAVMASKEYFSFQSIVIDLYNEMIRENRFKKQDHFYKLSIEYMICHVLYRSRNFTLTLEYLKTFKASIEQYNRSHEKLFESKYLLLYAAANNYLGELDLALTTLSDAIDKYENTNDGFNMQLNLAVYQFQKENFSEAIKQLLKLEHTDTWYAKRIGKEFVMRKNLIELLTQFEKGNIEIAMSRIAAFKSSYKKQLNTPMYGRIKTFLGFIQDCIDKPYWVASEEFYTHLDKTLERWPKEKEDLQFMAFYCWIKSKMIKKSYYFTLVETVNNRMN